MGDDALGVTRGRKRKRQVSWAAAELLEEVSRTCETPKGDAQSRGFDGRPYFQRTDSP